MDLFQQCHIQSVEFFSGLFGETIQQLPDIFIAQTADAHSDMQRLRYLEAHKAIQPMLQPIAKHYRMVFEQGFRDFSAGRECERGARTDTSRLALVEKSQFEDDVAIRSMANKAVAENSEELWKLNRRFAVIRGGMKCTNDINPCGPLRLCDAMRDAYGLVELDPSIKLQLYKLYDQKILARIGEHYQLLNKQLAGQGVLKTLSFAVTGRARACAAGGTTGPDQPAAEDVARGRAANDAPALAPVPNDDQQQDIATQLVSPEVERRQARVMEAIQAVQQRRRQSDQPRNQTFGGASYGVLAADGVAGQGDTFSQRELAIALGVLQAALQLPAARHAQPRRVSDTEKKFMGELGNLADQRQKVTSVDADTIDLVGMLFDYMLDDPQLPDGLKSLLSHLHTPYLKVALIDKKFFASARHPARCLLDLMAAAGARWVRDGDDDEKVYQRIRMVVEKIIKEFDDDLAFFDELLKEFASFVKVLERRAELAAQRSIEAEKGLDQLRQAREAAAGEIARRIGSFPLPGPVLELLQQPWTDFLVFNYLRHGTDSPNWQSGLDAVDGIVASISPGNGQCGHGSSKAPEGLNAEIESGLASLGYDRDRGQRLLQALREAQQQAQRNNSAGAPVRATVFERADDSPNRAPGREFHGHDCNPGKVASAQQPETAIKPTATAMPQGGGAGQTAIGRQLSQQQLNTHASGDQQRKKLSFQEQRLADKLASVDFGTWFEFKSGVVGAAAARLKLCWYSSVSGNYMFVNHSGVKTAVITLADLVKALHEGSASITERENKRFFERALASVMGRLSKS